MRVAAALMVMLCMAGVESYGQTAEKAATPVARPAPTPAELEKLYAGGQSWTEFRGAVKKRADLWKKNAEVAAVTDATVARAKAIPGKWRLLAVAIDQCSDSVNTVPYIAKLLEQVPSLDMRIVNPTDGRAVMEAHRTPDGRAATPTVVLLNDKGAVAGCWIERPEKLRLMLDEEKAKEKAAAPSHEGHGDHGAMGAAASGENKDAAHASGEGGMSKKMEWYDQDKGGETVAEVVAMIEAAAAGRPACPYPPR